jgi:hypothetical protein
VSQTATACVLHGNRIGAAVKFIGGPTLDCECTSGTRGLDYTTEEALLLAVSRSLDQTFTGRNHRLGPALKSRPALVVPPGVRSLGLLRVGLEVLVIGPCLGDIEVQEVLDYLEQLKLEFGFYH